MADCLILTPDRDLSLLVQTAAEENQLHSNPVDAEAIVYDEQLFSGISLVVMDARFHWRHARVILPMLQQNQLPILFICSSHINRNHILRMYSGKCIALVYGCDVSDISRAIASLLIKSDPFLSAGSLMLNTLNHCAELNGTTIPLTLQEYKLLFILMSNPNSIITREELMQEAWDYPSDCKTRTVDIHIGRLRRKIGQDWIETVHRSGYRLNAH